MDKQLTQDDLGLKTPFPFSIPLPDDDTAPFWEGCKRHEFLIQQCGACHAFRYPTRPMCAECGDRDFAWVKSKGAGKIYSYAIPNHPSGNKALQTLVPYNFVLVELAEGVRVVSNLLDVPTKEIKIGMPVHVVFTQVKPGVVLPHFRRA